LHRAAYLAPLLAVWHLNWTSKERRIAPLFIVAVLASLLAARAPLVARAWRRWRGQGDI
jgi:DMSO/TMAO reductase YedYZ heme-binding membrane subunit